MNWRCQADVIETHQHPSVLMHSFNFMFLSVQVGNKSFGLEALMKHLGHTPSEVRLYASLWAEPSWRHQSLFWKGPDPKGFFRYFRRDDMGNYAMQDPLPS